MKNKFTYEEKDFFGDPLWPVENEVNEIQNDEQSVKKEYSFHEMSHPSENSDSNQVNYYNFSLKLGKKSDINPENFYEPYG